MYCWRQDSSISENETVSCFDLALEVLDLDISLQSEGHRFPRAVSVILDSSPD